MNPEKILKHIEIMGLSETSVDDIVALLQCADDLYYNDEESILQDAEYDRIRHYLTNVDPTNKYLLGVGSSVRGGKVNLPYQMGSLDQIYEGDIQNWIQKHSLKDEVAVVSNKLDGASAMVIYDKQGILQIAYSRGDGIRGADITRHIRKIPSVPQTVNFFSKTLVVRGENIISKVNFPQVQSVINSRSGKPYKNARNMVSGLMNASENPDRVYRCVDFVAYEIVGSTLSKSEQLRVLKNLGFLVTKYQTPKFNRLNDTFLTEHLNCQREDYQYEIDGLVIDIDSENIRLNMKSTSLNPAYAVKYKIADENNLAYAEVTDVEINISKDGYLKPRVQIKPVQLVGVTVTWATGFNMKFIKDKKIGPGAFIKITRSGDVIPYIQDVVHPMKDGFDDWFNNKVSKNGDTHWTSTEVDLVLEDVSSSSTARFEQLVNFFSVLDVPHLAEGNLKQMFDLGFETPESIILLTQEDISSLVNSQIIGKKIFEGLKNKLTNIPLYILMGAHPCFGRGIGVKKMKKLYEACNGDCTLMDDMCKITSTDGFDTKTAQKIVDGFGMFMLFLSKIKKHVTIAEYEAPKSGKFNGMSVVFTGFRSKELEQQIENLGGKMSTSVSRKTGLVVADDPTGSSGKLDKARDLGIKIINIEELKSLL